ncbi:MAG: dockerin type I domain-containing protein [Bacteroidales bacterium]|nr:dockerin type I domain-containing protein [Bacteroidales bacterium]MDZ4203896.1 dockerin type I domain-containing protein [Bacteroidales bacterium]
MCSYNIHLFDDYGDGWQGGVFGFRQNGVIVAVFGTGFDDGTSFGPFEIKLCSGQLTEIVVIIEDDYVDEVGFSIDYPWGSSLFSLPFDSDFEEGDVIFTFQSACEPVCDPASLCQYTVQLMDEFGDGWQGAIIGLRQNGMVMAFFGPEFIDGNSFGPVNLLICPDYVTEVIVLAADDYPEEVGFTIYNPWGGVLFELPTGGNLAHGSILYSFLSICTPVACPPPANVKVSEHTDISVMLSWIETAQATQWDIVWGLQGISHTEGTLVSGITQTNFLLSGLNNNTAYSAYVRSNCGSKEDSPWFGPVNFTTFPCTFVEQCAYTVELYDDYGDGWHGTVIGFKQGGMMVAYFGEGFDDGYNFGPVEVLLCDNRPTQIVPVFVGDYTDEIGFRVFDPAGNQIFHWQPGPDMYIGQILHSFQTDCPLQNVFNPQAFNAQALSSSVIGLTWIPNPANDQVMIAYNTANQFGVPVDGTAYGAGVLIPGGGMVLYVGNNTLFNHTGLMGNIVYYYKAWSVNNTNEYSRGLNRNARTLCGLQGVPLFEDFEAVSWGSIPLCWSKIVANAGPNSAIRVGGSGYNSNNSLEFYRSYDEGAVLIFISPEIATNLNTLFVNFDAEIPGRKQLYYSGVIIGTMSDPTNHTTFNALNTINIGDEWDNYEFHLTNYTGQDKYIALKAFYSDWTMHYIYIDNLLIASNVACVAPTLQAASNITAGGASLQWIPNGQEISWQLVYGPAGFNPASQGTLVTAITSTNYTLSSLAPNSPFDAYVRAVCGEGNLSNWSGPISFATLPAVNILLGDANCDGMVNVLDVITCVNYIMDLNPNPFCFENADVNASGTINVLDIIGIVNIIMSQ